MKSMKKGTKVKCVTCIAVAALVLTTAVTAVSAMACVTEAEQGLEYIESFDGFNYVYPKNAEIGENGEMIFDCSDMEVPEQGLNFIVCPETEAVQENNTEEGKELEALESFNYVFVEGETVNADGSVSIDLSKLSLEEGLNLISFSDPFSGEDVNIGFNDAEEEIDPEFSYTPSDEEIDEEMFV